MPRKTYAKKRYKKRKRKYNPIVKFRGIGFPKQVETSLVYNTEGSFTTTATGNQLFRANGLYDPDYTGAGHQPPQFDTFANVFDNYRVIGGKMKVTFVNLASVPVRVNLRLYEDIDLGAPGVSNASTDFFSTKRSRTIIMTPSGGARDIVTLTMGKNFVKEFGKKILKENSYQADIASDPPTAQTFVWQLSAQSLDSSTALNIEYNVELLHHTRFFNRIETEQYAED